MRALAMAAAAGVMVAGGAARAFTITPTYDDLLDGTVTWNQTEKDVVAAAIDSWTSRLAMPAGPQNIDVSFEFVHGNGEIAQWTGQPVSSPTGTNAFTAGVYHVIDINVDLMDLTLPNHTIFTLGALPFEDWDALTAIRHEIGHALGFATLYTDGSGQGIWASHVTTAGGLATFDAGGLNLALYAPGNIVHMADGPDLMGAHLANGTRKDVSVADLQALSLAYGYVVVPEPGTCAVLGVGMAVVLLRRRGRGNSEF